MKTGVEAQVRILIVQEDVDSARRVQITLGSLGYEVVGVAGTAEEAMALAVRETPDLALLGASVPPSRGGAEVSSVLAQTMGIPVVRLAPSESDPPGDGALEESSYFGYVTRPFDGPALRAAIEVALYRHHLESLLRASEGQFKAILQSTAEAVVATDARGVVTFANRSAEELLGREAQSMVGQDVSEVVELTSDLAQLTRHPVHQVLAVGRGLALTPGSAVRSADGAPRPVGGSVSVIQASGERIAGSVVVLTDVTHQRVTAELAEKREARYHELYPGDAWVRFVLDSGGLIQGCSEPFADLIGAPTPEALNGRTLRELLPVTVEYEYVAAQIKAAGEVPPHERVLRRMDGESVTVVMTLRATSGDPGVAVARIMDVTGPRRLQEQREAMRRMEAVGRTAGGLAHTLNNIFQIIRGTAELMYSEAADRASRDDLSNIIEAADRGSGIVRDILAVGQRRVTTDRLVEAGAMVRGMLDELAEQAGPGVFMALQLAQGPLWVRADPELVRHALVRLVDNAREAMPRGGRIVLTLGTDVAPPVELEPDGGEPEQEYVTIKVTDSGEGMDQAILELALDPFFSTRTDGVGLGLSVAFGLARQHGGWLSLDSAPGTGTTATVYLPRAEAPEPE